MTKFSLLDTLWPLVKLYQLAGCFALERCESKLFHPIETWKYLLRHIVVCATIISLNLVCVIPMNFVEISRCEALTPILMFIFFYLVGVVLVMIGYGFSILEKLDHVTLAQVVAYVIIFTFMMIVSGGPILTTILIYSDICEHLVLWIKEVRYVCMST